MKTKQIFAILLSAICVTACSAEVTTITLSDTVVQKDISPLGINVSGDSYYGPPKMKVRWAENFEGTIYRQCHQGTLFEDGFGTEYINEGAVEKYWAPDKANYRYLYPGAEVTIISGPAYGEKRTIKELSFRDIDHAWKHTMKKVDGERIKVMDQVSALFFVFDKPISLPDGPISKAGIMINSDQSAEGCTGGKINPKDTYWLSTNLELSNDVMPGKFGKSSLLLDGSKSQTVLNRETKTAEENGILEAYYSTATSFRKFYDTNGKWHIKLKAKRLDKDAEFVIRTKNVQTPEIIVPVTDEWQEFEFISEISGIDKLDGEADKSFLIYQAVAKGGKILIDDFMLYKETDDKNPTVFMDSFVNTLKHMNPGILRHLMEGGDMLSTLSPRILSTRASNNITSSAGPNSRRNQQNWGLGEFYELCEYLNAEAWFCLPGTLRLEDIDLYMEYIGGPAGTRGGDLRIAHGHPKPWTESLRKIHVEPGNECWNTIGMFLANSYNGPDYWEHIFERVKASPYYKENVICHAAGQNYSTGMSDRILGDTPSADKYAIAPYQVHGFKKVDMDQFESEEDFFRYCMAFPAQTAEHKMKPQDAIAKKHGKELSVYEINWHMTGGDINPKGKGPNELRDQVNRFTASTPGGLGHINHMLMLVKDFGMRSMCHFTFGGNYFNVKLWGVVLGMGEDLERFRPAGLLFSAVNETMKGDLIETTHSKNQPTFSATGNFPQTPYARVEKGGPQPVSTVEHPTLSSYAFKDGNNRSLVLINMDLENEQTVKLDFSGSVKSGSVSSKRIAPENYLDNNELESGESAVKTESIALKNFKPGTQITLPPSSCQTIQWTKQ